MQKLIFTLVIAMLMNSQGRSQTWDRHMEVKKMNIRVTSDAFTATTFIEMEFYNPTATEMEGLYNFQLEQGQAITAFQLDLFGKYRDGSIEEKWKATNAYNTIVGKRVDPALLTMNFPNNYSLRIYPVPAKSSRKITMTIQQLLQIEKEKAVYKLPLNSNDIIEELNVQVEVKGSTGFPSVIKGLLQEESFGIQGSSYSLSRITRLEKADKPLSFSIPLTVQQHTLCVKPVNGKTYFALRLKPAINRNYKIQPQRVTVLWDVSTSGTKRNVYSEISFLKQYVAANQVRQLTIVSFNQHIQDTAVFFTGNNSNSRWVEYLQAFSYEGATQFGVLDFSKTDADAILVFSDGKNSFGPNLPVQGKSHVYCINSAAHPDPAHLEKIIGKTGGQYIDLNTISFEAALAKAGKAENILLAMTAGTTKLDIDQESADLKEELLLLTGTIPAGVKTITLSYGNNEKISETETIDINDDNTCTMSAIDRIHMLSVFDSYTRNTYWMSALEFGKQEKVVTLNTAYIVLEKIEDYIKFNITPPKELESQCDMNIFVKADEQRRLQYKKVGELEILTGVAQSYNERIATLDKKQSLIVITKENAGERFEKEKDKTTGTPGAATLAGSVKGVNIQGDGNVEHAMAEVVVTAMGQTRQPKELGYSVSRVRSAELTQGKAVNLQNGLTGKVSGLNVTTTNSGVFGDTRITLRGIRSLTGNNQPMLVLDGFPIDLKLISSINPNDVTDVTILKSPASTAIYGPDGANGALVITTRKRGYGQYSYYWGNYKLKNQDDEDYLADLKEATHNGKMTRYYELKKIHGDGAGFYFDAAQHLFEKGFRNNAMAVLFSAAEITGGDKEVLRAIGYTLEGWKKFDEAIKVYQQLLEQYKEDLHIYRDLALAYYQDGNYQQAINTFYEGILKNFDDREFYNKQTKSMMLQEMNAIISIHGSELDLSGIHKQLVRPLTVDMRIVLDCNNRKLYNALSVVEPGGAICFAGAKKSNGHITRDDNYYYYGDVQEYQVKEAKEGKYRVKVSYSDYSSYNNTMKVPTMIRIVTFKNFGKTGQSLEVENVIMDNQNGIIEIGEVKW
jgi:TonB-dependent SusC/RagA subfamily outer membrane receptor